jgi:hypothetical protein
MSFDVGNITGNISLNPASALAAEKSVVQGAREMKIEFDKSAEAMDKSFTQGAKNAIKSLNSEFGKKSLLGQGIKLAMGGGAIGGVSLAAKEFEALTADVAKTADAYRMGELTGRDLAAEVARQIPIIGTAVKAWDNLGYAITGVRAEMEKDATYAKASEDAWKQRIKWVDESKAATLEWAAVVHKLNDELEVLRAAPEMRSIVQEQVSGASSLDALGTQFARDAGIVDAKTGGPGDYVKKKKELNQAIAERDRLMKQMKSAQSGFEQKDATYQDKVQNSQYFFEKLSAENARNAALNDVQQAQAALDVQAAKVQNLQTEMSGLQQKADAAMQGYMGAWVTQSAINAQKLQDETDKAASAKAKATEEEAKKQWSKQSDAYEKSDQMLQNLSRTCIQNRTEAEISALKAAGKDTQAAIKEIYADREQQVSDLNAQLQKAETSQTLSWDDVTALRDATEDAIQSINMAAKAKAGAAVVAGVNERDSRSSYELLPINTVAAREFFGGHVVTAADMPATYQKDMNEVGKNTAAGNYLLEKILAELRITNGPQNNDTSSIEVVDSDDW